MAPETLKGYRRAYYLEMLTDEDWEKVILAYYSMVSYVDNCVGKIYEELELLGLSKNSIVVYTSDHGDFTGEHGCVEKYDTIFYDCLMKIPLFIQYPNKIQGNRRLDSMVENVDILPTILELAGIDIPENVHGKSLVPYLFGVNNDHKNEVFCEGGIEEYAIQRAPHYDSAECERMRPTYYRKQKVLVDYPKSMQKSKAIRTKEWKLIYRQDGSKELYNMLDDPDEIRDVHKDPNNREIITNLMEKLLQWMMRPEPDTPKIKNLYA